MNAPKLNWEVLWTTKEANGNGPIITKKLAGHVDHSAYPSVTVDIDLTRRTPANASGPVPVKMEFGEPRVFSVSGPALSEDECVAPGTHMAVAGSRQRLGYAIYIPPQVCRRTREKD